MKNLVKIKKALISLSDKSDLKKILDNLNKYKIEIISSGGTCKEIKKLGFSCKEISDYTGFKEMLDGRIKTLHPKIHAGILSIRSNKKHKKQLKYNNFEEIDLVIVNFYPLEEVVKKTINLNKIIKNIDIGGPTLVRAAAKNFKDVAVITSPLQYNNFLNEIKKNKGSTNLNFRHKLASYAFSEIAYYDSVISNCLNNQLNLSFPHKKTFHGKLIEKLRYGENKSFENAFNCDPISAFGGIVYCNYRIKKELAHKLSKKFFEIIIGKGFDKDALKILKKKINVRLIDSSNFNNLTNFNPIFHKDSFLLQDTDNYEIRKKNLTIVSNKKPNKDQLKSLIFALNVCKHVKSNAIVLAKNISTIGIGSGQPNRLDSCKIAINKANQFLPLQLNGSVAASDAFFPFTDGIEKLIQAGVSAIIQPSGSIRDKEIIKFANKTDTILVFSKTRHFKH